MRRLLVRRTRRWLSFVVEAVGRRLRGLCRAVGQVRPPLPDTGDHETPTKSVRASVLSATLCLGVAALLVSGKIVEIADRLPLGPDRDRWLEAATETDDLANSVSLNRPYDLLRDLRGVGDEAGQQIDVIGDVEDLLQPEAPTEPDQAIDDAGAPSSSGESPVAPTTTAATPSPTTTTVPEDPPAYVRPVPVTSETPLRVWVAGDSQALYLGQGLRRDSPLTDVMEITLDQRHSTGLSRPSYFNWPVHLFAIAGTYNPELVVATLGSNDWQSMTAPGGDLLDRGTDEWNAEWSRRLGVLFDVLKPRHRHVIWVGLPPTRRDDFREGYALMNQLAAAEVAKRDFVSMIDIWDMFGGDEPYRDAVPSPDDPEGRPVLVRQQDGVHLNRTGSSWVVGVISGEIQQIINRISPQRPSGQASG
ncbi:MAG: DUF459 domain-containing protein [Acidimicrobiaceae bacterium]|nr:DUF459 domain-containing protein [Acidimicrobiaceae bacterium]MYA15171.1 DUF459 domain-containing protein [Acidimicrobiaceae bacterium]